MFTGLVEELGTLVDRTDEGTSLRLQISAEKVLSDLKIDDSVALDGCCQTVVARGASTFEVIAVRETLSKTTLGSLKTGDRINLERAATLSSRLGGHLVQGHVDGRAELIEIKDLAGSWEFYWRIPAELMRFIIPIGSIALAGVSLTVADRSNEVVKTAIIPHTFEMTTFHLLAPGSRVNVEVDLMAKFVDQLLQPYRS